MVGPSEKRIGVWFLKGEHEYSERQACHMVSIPRSVHRYQRIKKPDEDWLRERIRELANQNKRYGCPRIHTLINREASVVNIKRIHRIWKEEGLQLPRKRPKKRNYGPPGEVVNRALYENHVWSWDFVFDRTERGGQLKFLTIIDEFTRESLALPVSSRIGSQKVMQMLDYLFLTRGKPKFIRSDNGPEFVAYRVQDWLRDNQCDVMYIKPGSPWENAYIESFNGKFRDECLNMHIFRNVPDAERIVDYWRDEYNNYRPHSSLGNLTPVEFAARASGVLRATPFVPLKQLKEVEILSS
jgi:transposase InsO family protein